MKIKIFLLVTLISLTVHAGISDLLQNIPENIQRHPCWSAIAVVGIPTTYLLLNQVSKYVKKYCRMLEINLKASRSDRKRLLNEKLTELKNNANQGDKDALLKLSQLASNKRAARITLIGLASTSLLTLYGWAKVTGIKK